MATNRPPFFGVALGSATVAAITVAGAQVGDMVSVFNGTDLTVPAANAFEPVVSVAGQVQQTSAAVDFSAKKIVFLLIPQGWKSIQN